MKRIIISERQLPLLKQVLKEGRLLNENKTQGKKSKIVIISERQVPLLEKVLREKKEKLDEGRLMSLSTNTPFYVFNECNEPSQYIKHVLSKWKDPKDVQSEYFLLSQTRQGKEMVRKSAHWSQYIIPYTIPESILPSDSLTFKNILRGNRNVHLVFGTQQPIRENNIHFSIKLNSINGSQIPLDYIKQAINGKDQHGNSYLYSNKDGIHFLSLDSNTLGLKDNKVFCGTVSTRLGDENVMGIHW